MHYFDISAYTAYIHRYIHTCIHAYMPAYMHTYVHRHIHTHIFICMHTRKPQNPKLRSPIEVKDLSSSE